MNTRPSLAEPPAVPQPREHALVGESAGVADLSSERSERAARATLPPRRRASVPSALVSLIIHTALFLLLALIGWQRDVGVPDGFELDAAFTKRADDQPSVDLTLASGADLPPPSPETEPLFQPPESSPAADGTELGELLLAEAPVKSAHSSSAARLQRLVNSASSSTRASFSATGTAGRSLEKRAELARARGGTLESEQAVERALQWLAAHQLPSGGWSLVHDTGECNGQCPNPGSKDRFDAAATGLSLLAFMGAGYTHREGKYRETVRRGVYFLLQIMEDTPQGGSFLYQSDRGMYNHGIAAFALCEAYQLTSDPDLKKVAQESIDFIVNAQNYQGGWGYLPKKPGDLTISGWQTMALKSAYAAGLEVPPSCILRLDPFLDSQMASTGVTYGYTQPGKSPTCTSIGMLIRMFRGWPHTDSRLLEGGEFLLKQGVSKDDAYFNYYATLTLFHLDEAFFKLWNPTMRDHLVATQATTGHEAGSWYFDNPYGKEGGRLYTTAMCAMTLEVYYRFSPLYQQTETSFEL